MDKRTYVIYTVHTQLIHFTYEHQLNAEYLKILQKTGESACSENRTIPMSIRCLFYLAQSSMTGCTIAFIFVSVSRTLYGITMNL
jgi:hypothetical protein